jgi:RHS repeat-associated protein
MHEHIDEMGIINMDGRIYDPLIGRFMSADPKIQAPRNFKSFNGYSCVWNNPLKMVDLDGFNALDSTTGSYVQNDSTTRGGTSAETCRSGCSEGGDDPKPQKPPANTPVAAGSADTQNPNPAAVAPPVDPTPPPVERKIIPVAHERPEMNAIANSPTVQREIYNAWTNSNPDTQNVREQRFWITRDEDSKVLNVVQFSPNERKDGILKGPMPPDAIVHVHTHPTPEHIAAPEPSIDDRMGAIVLGKPGIVITRDAIYIYSPSLPEEKNRFTMPSFD